MQVLDSSCFCWDTERDTAEIQKEDRRVVLILWVQNRYKGKMKFSVFLIIICMYGTSAVGIMPELKHNVLTFGYGVNFRYEGMLLQSFDRFYMVTKIEIPKVLDLNLTLFQFDYNCSHVVNIEKSTKFKIMSTIKEMFEVYC